MEAAALARALGDEVRRVPVSSSKAQIGHTLGAAGAIEAVITALVVARRTLVPTAGLDEPDATIGLVHVPHVGREVPPCGRLCRTPSASAGWTPSSCSRPPRGSATRTPPDRRAGRPHLRQRTSS